MNIKHLGKYLSCLLPIISACGGDIIAATDDELDSCLGFDSPSINLFVKDSYDDDIVIDTATVTIRSSDEQEEIYEDAIYVGSDDGLGNSMTGAYFSILGFNSLNYEVDIVVFAEGYHTFVTKGIEFELQTSCGASNSIVHDVYLCPIGTSCL